MCYKTLWKVGRIEGWGSANSGVLDPEHLRQKLCLPLGCAENVLAGLEEKGIIEDDFLRISSTILALNTLL